MANFWSLMVNISLVMCVGVLPFTYFLYETLLDDDDLKVQLKKAFTYSAVVVVFFLMIHLPMFYSLRRASIPLDSQSYSVDIQ